MRHKSIRQRLKQVESLIKALDQGQLDSKELKYVLPRIKQELDGYKFLLELLWVWTYKQK